MSAMIVKSNREILEFFRVLAGRIAVISIEESAEIFGGGKLKPLGGFADRKTFAEQKDGFL